MAFSILKLLQDLGPNWRRIEKGYYTRRKARLKKIADRKAERQDKQLTKDVLNILHSWSILVKNYIKK